MHLILLFYTGKNTAELAEEIQQLRERKNEIETAKSGSVVKIGIDRALQSERCFLSEGQEDEVAKKFNKSEVVEVIINEKYLR